MKVLCFLQGGPISVSSLIGVSASLCLHEPPLTLGCLVSVGFIERAVKKASLSPRASCLAETRSCGNQSGTVDIGNSAWYFTKR